MKSKRARDVATAVDDNDAAMAVDSPIAKKRKRDDEATDEVKQKKAKKDKKDKKDKKKDKKESRREKKDKRKDLQDLPEEDVAEESADVEAEATKGGETAPKKDSKDKKEKKDKKDKKTKEKGSKKDTEVNGEEKTNGDAPKKSKDKKDKKKANKTAGADASDATTSSAANGEEGQNGEDADDNKDRHIVFVGNLPFSATAETIKAHFATLNPTSVRCLKNKDDSNPCRGIAFVEFANVWSQRTCLDKFHHTMFSDGVSAPRKINIELTAGGGGKTQHRQDKIREKNKKLDENRTKRIEREKTAKVEGGANGAKKEDPHVGGIHPSRLARNPKLAH